jgi:8-hydroxy-5-deazaflavin:NADPH oxidoreductase
VKVAILGGTGPFGLALAARLVEAAHVVVIGSREAARAEDAAAGVGARGATNADAVAGVDLVVLAVNADAALATAQGVTLDAPLLSVASELVFRERRASPAEEARSLAERIQELVDVPVVAGLHSLAAGKLAHGRPAEDALVCGDDEAAKALALELAGGVVEGRAIDAGPLACARALEGMTAVIVNVNKRYKAHAGVRLTGLP